MIIIKKKSVFSATLWPFLGHLCRYIQKQNMKQVFCKVLSLCSDLPCYCISNIKKLQWSHTSNFITIVYKLTITQRGQYAIYWQPDKQPSNPPIENKKKGYNLGQKELTVSPFARQFDINRCVLDLPSSHPTLANLNLCRTEKTKLQHCFEMRGEEF